MAAKEPAPHCPNCQRVTKRIYQRAAGQTSNGYAPRGWMCDCDLVISPVGVKFALHFRRTAQGDVTLSQEELDQVIREAIDQAMANRREQLVKDELAARKTHRRHRPEDGPGPVDAADPPENDSPEHLDQRVPGWTITYREAYDHGFIRRPKTGPGAHPTTG